MKPVKFNQANITFAESQDEYLNLPAHVSDDGCVTTCWCLSWSERIKLLFSGRVWLLTLTYGKPIQPQLLQTNDPL